jgi:acetylornithine deacetylase/succinyl-diaminopimelate desuccinylase-like protein
MHPCELSSSQLTAASAHPVASSPLPQIANPILGQVLGQAGKEVSPFVRTTCGVVKVEAGGIAHNVLPRTGTITINCRVLPGVLVPAAVAGRRPEAGRCCWDT